MVYVIVTLVIGQAEAARVPQHDVVGDDARLGVAARATITTFATLVELSTGDVLL